MATRATPDALLHGDELQAAELGLISTIISSADLGMPKGPQSPMWQAPLQALPDPLSFFGCRIWGTMLYLKDGTEVDLTIYTAAFVQGLLADWYQHIQANRIAKHRRERDLPTDVDWTMVFRVMHSRRPKAGTKAAIMHFLAGFYPTRH
jgi:hypothetical protein